MNYIAIYVWDLVELAAAQDRHGGDIDLDSEGDAEFIDSLSILDLDAARLEAQRMRRAVRAVLARVDHAIQADVEKHGAVRLGDEGLYIGNDISRRVNDPGRLIDWLYETAGLVGVKAAVGVSERNLRVTALRAIAVDNGYDPQTVLDSLLSEERGVRVLKRVPVSKAKWVAELVHGGRR